MDKSKIIRDAATVILLRQGRGQPEVLMGQRGAKAAFMPSKYVFPGGAVDAEDALVEPGAPLPPETERALRDRNNGPEPHALGVAAVRELWEEAGLPISIAGTTPSSPGWAADPAFGGLPNLAPLQFIFRAITPPGRPRRFDARFFLVDADALDVDLDDFSRAEDELSHLHWIALAEARSLPLPFITEIVLAEVEEILRESAEGRPVPFFDHDTERSVMRQLRIA